MAGNDTFIPFDPQPAQLIDETRDPVKIREQTNNALKAINQNFEDISSLLEALQIILNNKT